MPSRFLNIVLDSASPPLRFPLLSSILLPPFTYVYLFIALFLFLFLDLSVFLTFLRLSIPFPLLPIFRLYPAHSSLLMSHRTHYSVFLSLFSLLLYVGLRRSHGSVTELAIPQIVTARYHTIDSGFLENRKAKISYKYENGHWR